MSNYITTSAVLFLVFNRPDTTEKVFETIRMAKPPRLYIASDGPRKHKVGEEEKVKTVRDIVSNIDWECEVKTLYREENLGCKYAVSSAITWFFDHEEQGVILEDDCLPSSDFFRFCDEMLYRYKYNDNIWVITGNNFQNGVVRGDGSYYFSRYVHIWGWASWRRAWNNADMDIRFWPEWKTSSSWRGFWRDSVVRNYWEKIFDQMYRSEIDTWDYQWSASVWYHGGLTVTPNVNLVSNIGFGPDATHTFSDNSWLSAMKMGTLGELNHPKGIEQDAEADLYVFDNAIGGKYFRFPLNLLLFISQEIRKINNIFFKNNTK